MKINEERVSHYNLKKVPLNELRSILSIEPIHLKEKDSWYYIDSELNFFKARSDYRLIGELLCQSINKELGHDIPNYKLAYINGELGLISQNFREPSKRYYHASDLYAPKISSLMSFGEYSLKSIINYFDQKLDNPSLKHTINTQLCQLFLSDYFEHQQDRNFKNIIFEIGMDLPIILGKIDSIHGRKITSINLSKIFDSEKSFSISRSGIYDYKLDTVWDTSFKVTPKTRNGWADKERMIDQNLFELYVEYPEYCIDFMKKIERLSIGKILENYNGKNSQLTIKPKNYQYLKDLLERKQEGISKVLSL